MKEDTQIKRAASNVAAAARWRQEPKKIPYTTLHAAFDKIRHARDNLHRNCGTLEDIIINGERLKDAVDRLVDKAREEAAR